MFNDVLFSLKEKLQRKQNTIFNRVKQLNYQKKTRTVKHLHQNYLCFQKVV